eukprot:788642-Prorocentrum_minimum.AAC.2
MREKGIASALLNKCDISRIMPGCLPTRHLARATLQSRFVKYSAVFAFSSTDCIECTMPPSYDQARTAHSLELPL